MSKQKKLLLFAPAHAHRALTGLTLILWFFWGSSSLQWLRSLSWLLLIPLLPAACAWVGYACIRAGRLKIAEFFLTTTVTLEQWLELVPLLSLYAILLPDHLGDLSMVIYRQTRDQDAESVMMMALAVLDKRGEGESLTAAALVERMPPILGQLGRYAEAEQYSRRAIEIYKSYGSDLGVMAGYESLCATLTQSGRYEEAEKIAREQLAELDRRPAASTPDAVSFTSKRYLSFLNNLGCALNEQGKMDEAVETYKQALELKLKTGASSTSLAIANSNIGWSLCQLGQYAEALPYSQKAAELLKEHDGEERFKATIGNVVGKIHLGLGDFAAAEKYMDTALKLRQGVLPGGHPDFAESHVFLGELYCAQERYGESEDEYQKAMKILKSQNPPNACKLGRAEEKYNELLEKLGRDPIQSDTE